MKELDLKLTKGLLDSVTNVLKDSSKVKAEQDKATNEQLAARYKAMPKPTSMQDAKVESYAAKAPERRLNDAITAVYTKSFTEANDRAKAEADAIKTAYAARGGVKPVTESTLVDEGMHVMPQNNDKADSRYSAVTAHAKKMGYNVHHEEHYGYEKSGNKGSPDITIHYQRGDDRKSASPEAIEIHKSGKAAGDKVLKLHAMGKNAGSMVSEALTPKQKKHIDKNKNNKIDAHDFEILRTRKAKMAADVSDETILNGETISEEEDHDTVSYPLSKDEFKDGMKHASDTSGTVHTSKTHHVKETEAGSSTDANVVYGIHDKATGKIHGVSISAFNKTTPEKVAKATGSSTVNAAHKALAAHHNETTYVAEERDTPGNSTHQCAIHVKHASLGEGRTLLSQHAEPDAEGQIAWYDVMFAEGIEKKVPTTDLEIIVSESHMNHKKKKKM